MNYVILSKGSYDDYKQRYYAGLQEITKERLISQAEVVSRAGKSWFEGLPKRLTVVNPRVGLTITDAHFTRFDPATNELVYSSQLEDYWIKEMERWLFTNGYTRVIDAPEVNYEDYEN